MSIDFKKLKKLLETHYITPVEYFCLDKECAVIKCFFNKNGEFLIIYVPSKFRFTVKAENGEKIYDMDDAYEQTENDDYTKTSSVPDMSLIEKDPDNNSYKELSKKYEKNISLEGNDEPVSRKIKRQIDRVRIPFSRLSYDIALQNGKWLCMSFGGDNSLFTIRSYDKKIRSFLFLVVLTDLIENIEKLSDQVSIISDQFYGIIHKVAVSNLDTIKNDIDNYQNMVQSVIKKHNEYLHSLQEYRKIYETTTEKENGIIKSFREKINKEQGLARSTMEQSFQKQYDAMFKTRLEIVGKGIELSDRFQRNLLILEEVSFDNVVMLTRVRKNFDLFKEIL